ncbi:3-methyl-2-oxobutanoate hydroxymethyltransferase [Aminobacter sp. Y103A]|nr:3-methyl-2-oxobutanoate hydroxymethyltransferase [Aminobacter sp. SS-2016]
MSAAGVVKAITPPNIRARKGSTPLVCLTAYTTPVRLVDGVLFSVSMARHPARGRRSDTIGPTMTALRLRQLDWDTKRRAVERAVDCGRRQQEGCNASPTEVRAVPINANLSQLFASRAISWPRLKSDSRFRDS